MFGRRKSPLEGKNVRKKAVFTAFDTGKGRAQALPLRTAYNCDCRDGKLHRGLSLARRFRADGKQVRVGPSATMSKVFFTYVVGKNNWVEREAMFTLSVDGWLYHVDIETGDATKLLEIGENGRHALVKDVDGKTYNLFSGSKRVACYVDDEAHSLFSGGLKGGCAVGDRFFILSSPGVLRYTAAGDPLTTQGGVNDGGSLYIPADCGELLDMAVDDGALYLIYTWGIYRLRVAAEVENFRMEKVGYNGGKIREGSVIGTGKGIFFLSGDGIYLLRGDSAKRVCEHLEIRSWDRKPCSVALSSEGLAIIDYYERTGELQYRIKTLVISADGSDGFFGEKYGERSGSVWEIIGNEVYRIVDNSVEGTDKYDPSYETPPMRFGTDARKVLKGIKLYGSGGVNVEVREGEHTHSYALIFENGVAETRLSESGKEFVFVLYPNRETTVTGLEIDFVCCEK